MNELDRMVRRGAFKFRKSQVKGHEDAKGKKMTKGFQKTVWIRQNDK
jgi:hypothetical protein